MVVVLRAHHLLCLQGFVGEGYSREFIKNMYEVLERLKEEKVKIVVGKVDDICSKCPNNVEEKCNLFQNSEEVISLMDKKVGEILELNLNNLYIFDNLIKIINENINTKLKAFSICGNCRWQNVCIWYKGLIDMTREEAIKLIKEKVRNENLVKHMLATAVVMEKLAEKFNEDKEKWFLAGVLHDIDLGWIEDQSLHGVEGAKFLEEIGVDKEIVDAVREHVNGNCSSLMSKALYSADPVTGLIVAAMLIRPDKDINNLKLKSLKKRFKEKRFAAGANREQIKMCEENLGIPLEEFLQISLEAMQENQIWR